MRPGDRAPSRLALLPLLLLVLLPAAASSPQPPEPGPWEFLSTSAIGADAFLRESPSWDGRGVVVAVLDTGVDPGAAGLQRTTTGEPKILDLRDFSGQGDVELERAVGDRDEHGPALRGEEGPWLRGAEGLDPAPEEGGILIGALEESALVNSAARDLDGNGRTDDVYGVLVYETAEHGGIRRRIVVDTDADGRVDDEEVRADFLEDPRSFVLGAGDLREGAPALALALNLWEDRPETVTFVFDDGAHGTHVAGIAAGHRIGGREGHDGIAPGAKVISLKIGDNALSGGATTPGSMWKAWRYAADFAHERGVPVMIQMSYGVGSEKEGDAVSEREIDRLLEADESLMGFTSCGNGGPGLSTAGLPAGASRIVASGAVLNRSTARDVYGVTLPGDRIFFFACRGGELAKPDVSAPGFAASTVPPWTGGDDVMRGTSMASPQSAGAAALLASAALQEGLPVVGAWLRAALRRGARPLPGVSVLDQGPGLLDVGRAWSVYRTLATRPGAEPLDWEVETVSPEMNPRSGPAAHWRGLAPPAPPEAQTVTVTPRFRRATTDAEKQEVYRAFDLVATAGFFRPDRRSVYSRSGRPIELGLVFDHEALAAPGLHAGRLLAYEKGLSRVERERLGPEWDLPVSVAVPVEAALGETARAAGSRLAAGELDRTFVRVPLGASSLRVAAEVPPGTSQRARVFLHDPEGRRRVLPWAGGDDSDRIEGQVEGRDLEPGVWEVVRYAHYGNSEPVEVDLELRFEGLAAESGPLSLKAEEGAPPEGTVTLTTRAASAFKGTIGGRIVGYRIDDERMLGGKTLTLPVPLGPHVARLDLRVSMSEDGWGRFTDVAVRVLDEEGEAMLSDGMSYARLATGVAHPSPGEAASLTVEVIGAVADPDDTGATTPLELERTYRYVTPVPVRVSGAGDEELVRLYPDRPLVLEIACETAPPALPEGAAWVLELELVDAGDERKRTVVELLGR